MEPAPAPNHRRGCLRAFESVDPEYERNGASRVDHATAKPQHVEVHGDVGRSKEEGVIRPVSEHELGRKIVRGNVRLLRVRDEGMAVRPERECGCADHRAEEKEHALQLVAAE